jgi:L-threonylcarbamoyladenylate synthase
VGIESAIVDASQGEPMLLRPGMLTVAALSAVAGREVRPIGKPKEASPLHAVPAAPGLLPSHYAPRARVRLMDAADIASMAPSFQGALAVWAREPLALPAHVHVKTMPSQAADCAHALFADLRLLDAQRVEEIWVQTPPDGDAWAGVHDRLQRAAA